MMKGTDLNTDATYWVRSLGHLSYGLFNEILQNKNTMSFTMSLICKYLLNKQL
jgi:hypothetical protein